MIQTSLLDGKDYGLVSMGPSILGPGLQTEITFFISVSAFNSLLHFTFDDHIRDAQNSLVEKRIEAWQRFLD